MKKHYLFNQLLRYYGLARPLWVGFQPLLVGLYKIYYSFYHTATVGLTPTKYYDEPTIMDHASTVVKHRLVFNKGQQLLIIIIIM